ncbi:unnamed protein product, partial [Closterium sp. Naga37s-1]
FIGYGREVALQWRRIAAARERMWLLAFSSGGGNCSSGSSRSRERSCSTGEYADVGQQLGDSSATSYMTSCEADPFCSWMAGKDEEG